MGFKATLVFLFVFALIVAGGVGAVFWKLNQRPPVGQHEWIPAKVIPEVKNVKTKKIAPPKQIVVLNKEEAVKKLALPESVAKNDNEQIIATAISNGGYEAPPSDFVAVMNDETGETEIIKRERDMPFLMLADKIETGVGVGPGISPSGGNVNFVTGYIDWRLVKVGPVMTHIYADYGNATGGKVEFRVGYEFDGPIRRLGKKFGFDW
jgi:hypothetical protein